MVFREALSVHQSFMVFREALSVMLSLQVGDPDLPIVPLQIGSYQSDILPWTSVISSNEGE